MSSLLGTLFSPVTAAWRFVKNNKKVVAAVAVGGVALTSYYAYRKLKPIL